MNIIAKETRHLRGKDLKISLSRRLSSETAQLNYLLDKKPTDAETKHQQQLVWWLQNWRKSLN
jgi:hypothetical protein